MPTIADDARSRCAALLADPAMADVAPAIERAIDRLDRPLVVAIIGHVSAGKSTLVNALAGRDVAATGAGETTLVSWWLRKGASERVIVRRRGTVPLELAIGDEPQLGDDELDLDAAEPITVWIESPLLDGLVLVDTPGLFSAGDDARSARARDLVRDQTMGAAGGADAVLYVSADAPGAARDAAELDAFAAGLPDLGHAPTNAVVVLTKADRFWPGDPLATAARALEGARDVWRTRAWQALPVTALLAAPRLDDEVLDGLRAFADSGESAVRLAAARARAGQLDGVQAKALRELGAYGCSVGANAVARGEDPRAVLRAASGIDAVRAAVERTFRDRALTIRTDRLLRELTQLALRPTTGENDAARLHEVIDEVRAGPHGAGLRTLVALRLAADPRIRISDDARDELRLLFSGGSPRERLGVEPGTDAATLIARARGRARWWRALEAMRPAAPDRRWLAAQAAATLEAVARGVDAG